MERRVAELVGETDVEALTRRTRSSATMLETLHPEVALACSFQKEESVLLDMLLEHEPKARVFALDTHVLFPETYDVWREVEQRYGIRIEVFEGPSLGRQAATHGDRLWERNPDLCCSIRKIGPLGAALCRASTAGSPASAATSRRAAPARPSSAGTSATSSGRRARSPTGRTTTSGRTSASASCPSTRSTSAATPRSAARTAPRPGTGREGRWAGTGKTECGLHA